MYDTYVRFVTLIIDEDSGKRQGLFQAIADLVDTGELPEHEMEELKAVRAWFNKHMDAPYRFRQSSRRQPAPKAISWYKSTATEHISKMHTFCRILNEHNILTQMITSTRPGYIIFEDDHQIAAAPFSETTT